jgi:hypothetical protein
MFKHLVIEYADPSNLLDTVVLKFKLRSDKVVDKWVAKVLEAQASYSIDDPFRFYGFNSLEVERDTSLSRINACIDTINSHGKIIERVLQKIDDYDTLNYLHHIFEVYHGLLDCQTHEFYISAPDTVKKALADLNVLVHRCESVSHGATPRNVVTYYGLPKTDTLDITDYNSMTDYYSFGTVYLLYSEIGKTLEDLAMDNDQYIADEAFKPLRFYTADFSVIYGDADDAVIFERRKLVERYYYTNAEFFKSKGLHLEHPHLKMGRIPLAHIDIDINNASVLELIKTRQYVKSVNFI